jgi:hypothetical protein
MQDTQDMQGLSCALAVLLFVHVATRPEPTGVDAWSKSDVIGSEGIFSEPTFWLREE